MRHRSLLRYDRRRKAMLFGFIVWLISGGVMVIFGIYAMHSKRANAEVFEVNDVRAYNRAVGRLWCVFGAVFILLGFPFLTGQNSPYFIVSILGCMIEAIVAMVVYVAVIEKKHRVR